jgi:hypothetical protein
LAETNSTLTFSPAPMQDLAQLRVPDRRIEPDVQKSRPCGGDGKATAAIIAGDQFLLGQRRGDALGQRHRVLLDRAGQHHRRVGREIAMRRVARRLDRDPREIEPRRQRALAHQPVERGDDETAEVAKDVARLCHTEP